MRKVRDERWTVEVDWTFARKETLTVVSSASIAARTELHKTHLTQTTRLRYFCCQGQRTRPVVVVLQRGPPNNPVSGLPTALQAHRFPAYRLGKALAATTPLPSTQSQHTAENYTKLNPF